MDIKLKPLIEALQKGEKAVFFLGAGVSTSCGIPDFRSPKTGLYAQLQRLKLPYSEAVFDIDYFRNDPKAFYTLCDELYPGKFFPSTFHFLLRLFQEKDLLQRVYTQNIDTLEQLAGVNPAKIIAAHGSFADNHCIDCNERMLPEELKRQMNQKTVNDGIPTCPKCKGYVKPDIVFFGESLPAKFFDSWKEDSKAIDIAIVVGTSLTVYPFAGLPAECPITSLRVLVNNEVVGDFKRNKRKTDIILKNHCDEVASAIILLLDWQLDLDAIVDQRMKKLTKNAYLIRTTMVSNHSTELMDSLIYENTAEEFSDEVQDKKMAATEKTAKRVAEAIKSTEEERALQHDLANLSI